MTKLDNPFDYEDDLGPRWKKAITVILGIAIVYAALQYLVLPAALVWLYLR